MHKIPYSHSQWRHLIPDIDRIIEEMDSQPILSVGITPFTRIIPSFFLKNYSTYTVKRSSDVDIMELFTRMHVLEDRYPQIAKRIHGTGYLIGNHVFQNFLKSRSIKLKLLFYTMTEKIVQDLNRLNISWIGNDPKTFDDVKFKGSFRELVKKLGLSALDSQIYTREEFLTFLFEDLWSKCRGAFVIQRGDKEVGGNEGTFFIHTKENFDRCLSILESEAGFAQVIVTPFINGHSTSMLGCVLSQGTLSGPLQLQFIDVPESLHGIPANGIFFGNDIGYRDWGDEIEAKAQKCIEGIGNHMAEQGYRGIFGIDFLFDKKRNEIFPIECNPRFTGSLLLYSLSLLESHVPPFEFFHLMAHLDIESKFNFDKVNRALKVRGSYAHISFSPKGIPFMDLPLIAGVYSYNENIPSLKYKGPGVSLADLKDKNDFLLIDTVPKRNQLVEQGVPRLFKFIFPYSIAKSSYEIEPRAAFLLERYTKSLIKATKKTNPTGLENK